MKRLVMAFLCLTAFTSFSQEENKKSGMGFYVYGGVQIMFRAQNYWAQMCPCWWDL